jgi:hypothetical protein
MADKLDAVQAWHALHPKIKEQLGAAAVALGVADAGVALADDTKPWDAASTECALLIHAIVGQHVLRGGLPGGLDLSVLGIQQCRQCGCTDNCACEFGCEWVEPDLCSACAHASHVL